MEAKLTLSFDKSAIENAKAFAEEHNISLSKLTEFIYFRLGSKKYDTLEDLPISDWVSMAAEGEIVYGSNRKSRKDLKNEFFKSSK
jgi:hypothetical protein